MGRGENVEGSGIEGRKIEVAESGGKEEGKGKVKLHNRREGRDG